MHNNFGFIFISEPENTTDDDGIVGTLPINIRSTKDLLSAIADALHFPAYFGENWNALYDCLRDFHWIDKKNILLVHRDLPNLPERELKAYLEILRDAVDDWDIDESHKLVVIFDERLRTHVLELLH